MLVSTDQWNINAVKMVNQYQGDDFTTVRVFACATPSGVGRAANLHTRQKLTIKPNTTFTKLPSRCPAHINAIVHHIPKRSRIHAQPAHRDQVAINTPTIPKIITSTGTTNRPPRNAAHARRSSGSRPSSPSRTTVHPISSDRFPP